MTDDKAPEQSGAFVPTIFTLRRRRRSIGAKACGVRGWVRGSGAAGSVAASGRGRGMRVIAECYM